MANQGEISIYWGSSTTFREDKYLNKVYFSPSMNWYELTAQHSYFCYVTNHSVFSAALVKSGEILTEGYIWIETVSSSSFVFGMLIEGEWLRNQLLPAASAEILKQAAEKVLKRWQQHAAGFHTRSILFEKKYREHSYRTLTTQAYFYELIYRFVSEIDIEVESSKIGKIKNPDHLKIREVIDKVLQSVHLPTPLIEHMAFSAGMSASKFKIIFKEIYGIGPHQYLLEQKLAYAHTLLKSGKYTLTQIAYKIGYSHTSGFTRIYKKKYQSDEKPN
ncbi:MAG: AraC family transcriptional regulator [Spirosomataceae bacterium]